MKKKSETKAAPKKAVKKAAPKKVAEKAAPIKVVKKIAVKRVKKGPPVDFTPEQREAINKKISEAQRSVIGSVKKNIIARRMLAEARRELGIIK